MQLKYVNRTIIKKYYISLRKRKIVINYISYSLSIISDIHENHKYTCRTFDLLYFKGILLLNHEV